MSPSHSIRGLLTVAALFAVILAGCQDDKGLMLCPALSKPCLPDCDDPASCTRGSFDSLSCRCIPLDVECVEDAECAEGRLCYQNKCVCLKSCPSGTLDEEACSCIPEQHSPSLTAVRVLPEQASVKVGEEVQFTATATFDDGSETDITRDAAWESSDNAVAAVSRGKAQGLAEGTVTITASSEGLMSNQARLAVTAQEQPSENHEARALWVTRWNYRNEQDVRTVIENAASANFNIVLFQVRGEADAYYRSTLEPWGKALTGQLGQDPGWDPLAAAVSLAHSKGLQLHAWINTLTAWSGEEPPVETSPRHILLAHPEWAQVDESGNSGEGDYIFVSPGIPAVREHIAAVIQEIVRDYEVDGVHLDYIRYAGRQFSHDAVSEQRYLTALESEPGLSREDWQRQQVNEMVRMAFQVVQAGGPQASLTAAVWGIYENRWNWSGVSQGFHDYYQDSRAWARDGYIDGLCPMIYWPPTHPPGGRLDYRTLVEDFVSESHGKHIYAGMQVDREFEVIAEMIGISRELDAQGQAMFAYSYLASRGFFDDLAAGPYAEKADVPPRVSLP